LVELRGVEKLRVGVELPEHRRNCAAVD